MVENPAVVKSEGSPVSDTHPQASLLAIGDVGMQQTIQDVISAAVTAVIGLEVDGGEPLFAAGLDSLTAVELRNVLAKDTGLKLPSTLLFDCPTTNELSAYIYEMAAATLSPELSSNQQPLDMHSSAPVERQRGLHEQRANSEIACCDIAAKLSGCNMMSQPSLAMDSSTLVRLSRWDSDRNHGGVSEAAVMDPQHWLVLDTIAECQSLYNAALVPSLGIYLGIWPGVWQEYLRDDGNFGAFHATGTAMSAAAGRVSFQFGLQGPCVSIDTACSASMVAAHIAARDLLREATAAVVAGVSLLLSPSMDHMIGAAGMLSPDGRS
eukprot:scaffold87174_cov45-Prasinocladus_malaysianus.AAC.1